MNGLEQTIATLGFPVAVSLYLLYERAKVRIESREDKNRTIDMVAEALTNNTEALVELKTLIQERLKQ